MHLILKCKICRLTLNDKNVNFLNGHNEPAEINNLYLNNTCLDESFQFFYIQEEKYPTWISEAVSSMGWASGKLKCPNCSTSLGSVDFIEEKKCSCGTNILLPVKLHRSKLDTTWM